MKTLAEYREEQEQRWRKSLAAAGIRNDSWLGKLLRHVSTTRKLRWNSYLRGCRKVPKSSPVYGSTSWKRLNQRRCQLINEAFGRDDDAALDHDPEFKALQSIPYGDAPMVVSNFVTARMLRRLEKAMKAAQLSIHDDSGRALFRTP